MILYHGTNIDIQTIDLIQSRVGKDFGVGFYLTPDFKIAVRQANRRADIDGGVPYVLSYDFTEPNESNLKVAHFECYSREWAEFVKMNRDNRTRVQSHDYDIVVGPIADDDIGMQMRRFKVGQIGIDQFLENIKYKQITIQYFFGTERALDLLNKVSTTTF